MPPSAPSFSPFSETGKYKLHIGLHLKSIISRVANSVIGLDPESETHRNEAGRAESGGEVLGRGQRAPSPSVRGSGGAL